MYTDNKHTYIHSTCIQLQINTSTIYKNGREANKVYFLFSQEFIINMDTFLTSISFSFFIGSIKFGIFILFSIILFDDCFFS